MNITKTGYQTTNPQFKGYSIPKSYRANIIAGILSCDKSDILDLTRRKSAKRFNFLDNLAEQFLRKDGTDTSLVYELFDLIKRPSERHLYVLERYRGPFENLGRIFRASSGSKKRLDFVKEVNERVVGAHSDNVYEGLIPELLESEHSKEYIKHFDRYKSYLRLNREKENVVTELDRMVSEKTFDSAKYDREYKIKKFTQRYGNNTTEAFTTTALRENYSESRQKFIDEMYNTFFYMPNLNEIPGADKELMELYLSTTEENVEIRNKIIKNFGKNYACRSIETEDLKSLRKLFDRVENDGETQKFMEDMTKNKVNLKNIDAMNEIFDTVPIEKLMIFKKNFMRIASFNPEIDFVKAVQTQLENPLFKKGRNPNLVEKFNPINYIKSIINEFRIMKYERLQELKKAGSEVKPETAVEEAEKLAAEAKTEAENVSKEAQKSITEIESAVEETSKETEEIIIDRVKETSKEAEETVTDRAKETSKEVEKAVIDRAKETSKEVEEAVIESAKETSKEVEETVVEAVKEPQTADKTKKRASKEEIAKNILDFVKTKLGPKTFDRQNSVFSANATKMRLSMLPEIFASIAETRRVDREVGKRRINSSNNDALELFMLINGSNKKFINYLLKKRNVDGTRMFEVKDIIRKVRKIEESIKIAKASNPKFRANDARKIYNNRFEAYVQEYGKVKPQRKINKKA